MLKISANKTISLPFYFSFLKIYLRERESTQAGEGAERENPHADSPPSAEPNAGLNLTTHEIMT